MVLGLRRDPPVVIFSPVCGSFTGRGPTREDRADRSDLRARVLRQLRGRRPGSRRQEPVVSDVGCWEPPQPGLPPSRTVPGVNQTHNFGFSKTEILYFGKKIRGFPTSFHPFPAFVTTTDSTLDPGVSRPTGRTREKTGRRPYLWRSRTESGRRYPPGDGSIDMTRALTSGDSGTSRGSLPPTPPPSPPVFGWDLG